MQEPTLKVWARQPCLVKARTEAAFHIVGARLCMSVHVCARLRMSAHVCARLGGGKHVGWGLDHKLCPLRLVHSIAHPLLFGYSSKFHVTNSVSPSNPCRLVEASCLPDGFLTSLLERWCGQTGVPSSSGFSASRVGKPSCVWFLGDRRGDLCERLV